MIIIGCYADSFGFGLGSSPISYTTDILQSLVPDDTVVHLLPFYPSSGDHGFAPDSILQIDVELGTKDDILRLTSIYKCLFDGVYNHVGNGHPWVSEFFNSPDHYSKLIHAYFIEGDAISPKSPRGPSALQPASEAMPNWYFWRTFTGSAVDIRLEEADVIDYVSRHMDFLQELNAWALRLDAVAYYKKDRAGRIRHNDGVVCIANRLARMAYSRDFVVFAQLNRDKEGLEYFTDRDFSDVIINDFTYVIYLVLSLLRGEPSCLIDYDNRCTDGRICVRAPRTHDGLLLRSKSLSDTDREEIITRITSLGAPLRLEGGVPYELNCSLPFLLSRAFGDLKFKALEAIIAITGMSSGLAYFYLPSILMYEPELEVDLTDQAIEDPRSLNRRPITAGHMKYVADIGWDERIKELLACLASIRRSTLGKNGLKFSTDMVRLAGSVIGIETKDGRYRLAVNLGTEQVRLPDRLLGGNVLFGDRSRRPVLRRFEFVLSEFEPVVT